MAEAEVKLQQVCTGTTVTARLVGVTQGELDITSASTIFGYFRVTARSDQSLSAEEHDSLSYVVRGGGEELEVDETDAAVVISDKLSQLSMLVEKAIENDPDITEQDKNVIDQALPEGAGNFAMNLPLIHQHLMYIFQNFFSSEVVENCTPFKLLINFAMVLRYCYNFCKKVAARLRDLLASTLPESVFNLLCRVVSILLKHLSTIDWRTTLTSIGGWTGAVNSLALTPISRQWLTLPMPHQNIFLGIAIFSTGMYIYLKYFSNSS